MMLSFFVRGRPQPEAKRETAATRGGRKYIYKRDPDGNKQRWAENVRLCARRAMFAQKFKMIPAKVGVTVDYHFYFHRAKSNKDTEMVIPPDARRLCEAIDDALEGVCYHNDSQINRPLGGAKDYTTPGQAEGVMIQLWETGR